MLLHQHHHCVRLRDGPIATHTIILRIASTTCSDATQPPAYSQSCLPSNVSAFDACHAPLPLPQPPPLTLFALLLCNKYHYISFDDIGPTLQIDTATSTITAVRNTAYIEHSASVIQLESNQHDPSITQIFWPVCLVSASMRVVHVAYMFVPITFQLLGRFQRPLMLCFAAAASRAVCGACADDARELMIKLLFALTNLSPTLAKVRQHLSSDWTWSCYSCVS